MAADTREFRDSNLYIVPRIADGVSVAGRFDGLGLRANDSAQMRLDVEIDAGSRLGDEAVDADVVEIFVTGGEPFMLLDIDERLRVATAGLPTTVLTDSMV